MSIVNAYRRFVMIIDWIIIRFYIRKFEVTGREHVPMEGPLVIACNHLSNMDPMMVAAAMPRYPSFMMKKEMLWWPILGVGAWMFGSFTVDRSGADLKAIRTATEWVKRGRALVMFPEGTRSRTGAMSKGHVGTGLITLRTGARVLPVAVTGTQDVPWPWFILRPRSIKHVRVTIGEPFELPPVKRINTEASRQATGVIMRRIAMMLPPENRGVYADGEAREEQQAPAAAKEYTKK